MRFEHQGITIWYGTPDAPAPISGAAARTDVSITVGVQPADASNRVEVVYRVNQGEPQRVDARYLRSASARRAQYFRAKLPTLRPGDTVAYYVRCRCAGREVPPRDAIEAFTSSFTVVEAGVEGKSTQPGFNKNQPTPATDQITDAPTNPQDAPPQGFTVRDQSTPFRLSARKKKHLKNLTLGVAEGKRKEKLEQFFSETDGEFNQFKSRLEESEEFDKESIQRLTFNHDLAELMEDQEDLVAAFVHNNRTHNLRDIALSYRKQDLKAFIRATGIPKDTEVEDEEERLERFATKVNDRLFRMAPTAVIHRMVRDEEVAAEDQNIRHGLLAFFNAQPELDFRKTSVLQVLQDPTSLQQVPEEHREKVVDRLKKLQRLSAFSSRAEALPTLMKANLTSAYAINEVPMGRFVSLFAGRLGGEEVARTIHRNAQNITVRNEEAYVALRQAIQGAHVRMIHGDAPAAARVEAFYQIVQQKNIPINFETLFGSVDLCECAHCNSVYSPAAYLVELFQYLRNNNLDPENDNLDPENDNTGTAGYIGTPLEMLFRRRPDLGGLQLTCENTNTLIPYIDLVNEVMESFVFHLNSYEADTNIPKQAHITVHNVEDESSGELLSEPQHTNYRAYSMLKDEVYPVCKLPYHQPIDATRQYLNYLGTSRYELFETFRKDVALEVEEDASELQLERAVRLQELQVQSVDRAVAAEFLQLTEEEYVILTKESFHTKEWYELEERAKLTAAQYREQIGLKDAWAYYGIASEHEMLEELRWVKPAQESGIVGFLRRTNILYTDLIALLKTQYINPDYLSGKALAYMNRLRYSYRYLQSLVDESQTDKKLKYQGLVEFLQNDLASNQPQILLFSQNPQFDQEYVECWVYKYFAKIGKLIVLEDASSCNCIEGTIRLFVIHPGDDAGSYTDLYLDADCRIHVLKSDPKRYVGYLDSLTGKLVIDEDYTSGLHHGDFIGLNGEDGHVSQDLVLHIYEGVRAFICTDYQENCDISKTQLKHLDGTDLITAEYDRMHRFIRLWCKLGWTIEEVDQAISGVGEATEKSPSISANFLLNKSYVALMPSEDSDEEDEAIVGKSSGAFTVNRHHLIEGSDKTRGVMSSLRPKGGVISLVEPVRRAEIAPAAVPRKPGFPRFRLKPTIDPEVDCQPEPISQVKQEITPYLIEQLVAVKKLLEITGLELAHLLTFWTQIGIYGENSLYKRLFLKYNLLAVDDVFEEDNGTYLTQGATISNHLPVLMAALKVDTNMVESIMSLAEIPDELTLENVSRLYRHILLAKTLGLRVKELPGVLALMQDLAHPFGQPSQTLKFYDLYARIEDSGFSSRELNYVLRDEDDPLRPLRPSMANVFQLAIGLRDALLQIEIDHPNIKEDQEATEELLRGKLSLLYDGAIVEQTIGLVQGTSVYQDNTRRKFSTRLDEADQNAITEFLLARRKEEEEEQAGGEFQTFLQRVQFSGTKGLQITGILSETDRDKVNSLADLIEDLDAREKFLIVVNKIYAQPERFFEDALLPIFAQDPDAAKEGLLAEDIVNAEIQVQDSGFQKRAFLARDFMPYLREELRQRLVVQMLAANLGLGLEVTRALVMEVITTQAGDPLYQEIIRLTEQKDPEAEAQRWHGFFVPEKEGKYTFLLEAEGVTSLTFNHQPLWSEPERTDEEAINFYQSQPRFLKAGRAYPFILEGYDEDEDGNIIGLFMKFNDQAQVAISDKILFPALRTEAFRQAYLRLQKAAMVVKGFSIKLEEMEFFREFSDSFEELNFNSFTFPQWLRLEAFYRLQKSLPQTELSLVEFLRWAHQTEDAEGEPALITQINALTGWEQSDIYKMIHPNHFNLSHPEHFRDEKNLLKLQRTLHVANKIGVGIGHLFQWSEPSSNFIEGTPIFNFIGGKPIFNFIGGKPISNFIRDRRIAGSIRETIRARYTQEEWEEAIKPVHDQLRENQKQALIAYLLAQPVLMEWGVRDADSLFEFFLIDVQMDACMETSRIKQAISSVQLFVQRCFLGLEDKHGVSSEEVDRERWEWMSRYRVWEANRKVFLYPENWIRPELRDVKSPFFQELESELLQNDVSNETVTNALKKYFIQVDEVANLEVVGHYSEGNEEKGKIHVLARTRDLPNLHFYRYFEFDENNKSGYWYPWEKVEVDIPSIDIKNAQGEIIDNGSFVIPVVWNNRLFIFFPQLMQKSWTSSLAKQQTVTESAQHSTMEDNEPILYWEIKMAWSEYKDRRWTPKQISKQAIYSVRIESPISAMTLQPSASSSQAVSQTTVDAYTDPSKLIFAPFVKSEQHIKIQIYYTGKVINFKETVEQGSYSSTRPVSVSDPTKRFTQSFRFAGDSITLSSPASNIIPSEFESNQPSFHYISYANGLPGIPPLQAIDDDINPADQIIPAFIRYADSTSVIISNSKQYIFSHPHTKKILGQLYKGKLEKIFKNDIPISNDGYGIPISNDNYGSNDGIQYHELMRPYAIYNWEALFHSVSLLADHLTKSQRFEDAMKWWHYIFDPINVKGDIKNVWIFSPFRETDSKNVLEQIFNKLDPNTPDEDGGITGWRDNPFQPHLIARSRPTAYMKWVVMKYIDNLIAWGDYLFRQDTIESLNQATQLYVLAGHILGPRPEMIPKRGKIQPRSYLDLLDKWDAFSNALDDLELIFPFSNQINAPGVLDVDGDPHYVNIYGFATTLYFCIPDNPKLLEYWDTVADRLFKIRHCLNIEGVFRKLSLFEPPIDPALLVQAAAQGLSISSVLNDLSTPMPNYRFNYLLQRALEVTSEVKSLGNALLSALEKKDGESLSLLRAQHDTRIQNLMMEVRNKQLDEAEKALESLEENRESPNHRLAHYTQLLGGIFIAPNAGDELSLDPNLFPEVSTDGDLPLIPYEVEDLKKAGESKDKQKEIGKIETLANILHMLPSLSLDIKFVGVGGGFEFGGPHLGGATQSIARGLQIRANELGYESGRAGKKASLFRQLQERIFQSNLARLDLMQIDKQITAQRIRKEIAEQEIINQQKQIDQTQEVEEFLRSKYSNEQLYQWMSDQLKSLYYQTYSFAYDLAKKAEKVFRFEMGLSTSDFIKFGYWDSARDGFLAGEQLYLALKHLENAYVETKPHDYEITKHISLQQLNPLALIDLKETGMCEFALPEEIFDMDYPGHYKRRIKTVSVSIPCVVGPYTGLNCILRLLKHEYRNSKIAANASDYAKKLEEADERFVYNPIPTTAIAVSQGQNDSGVFELNFRDERYMPFEGAGAISKWRLELPQEFRQFNYDSISDVILHISYTAKEGGVALRDAATQHLHDGINALVTGDNAPGLYQPFSARHEFPTEFHRFLHPPAESEQQILTLNFAQKRFPYMFKGRSIAVDQVHIFVRLADEFDDANVSGTEFTVTHPGGEETADLGSGFSFGNMRQVSINDISSGPGEWMLGVSGVGAGLAAESNQLNPNAIEDFSFILHYTVK